MERRFSCHVLAHDQGRYRTTLSYGITPDESRAMEQFLFGQTNDARYLKSLADDPGIIWRRFADRVCLTRVRNGCLDANGRSTLLFETLLDDGTHSPLAQESCETALAQWTLSNDGARISFLELRPELDLHPEQVSEVILAVREDKRVVRSASMFSLRDVGKMITACVDRPDFSICYKSLNRQSPFQVNLVALRISEKTMPASRSRTSSSSQLAPSSRKRSSTTIPTSPGLANTFVVSLFFIILVTQVVVLWRLSNSSSSAPSSDTMQHHILTRIEEAENHQLSRIADLDKSLLARLSQLEKTEGQRYQELKGNLASSDTLMNAVQSQLSVFHEKQEELINAVKSLTQDHNKLSGQLHSVSSEIKDLRKDTKDLPEKVSKLVAAVAELSARREVNEDVDDPR